MSTTTHRGERGDAAANAETRATQEKREARERDGKRQKADARLSQAQATEAAFRRAERQMQEPARLKSRYPSFSGLYYDNPTTYTPEGM